MGSVVPIGRRQELDRLVALTREARAGHGRVVFLLGRAGSGRSPLLRAFAEVVRGDGDEHCELVQAACYETSAANPLGPFGEVLRALTSGNRRGERAKRVLELVGQVAPPLVELIPMIGKLAALGVKAASEVGIYSLGGDHDAQQAQLASDVAAALQRIAAELPLVVVIDDAQWIDAPSTEVIIRLARTAAEQALLLVVAYDDGLVDDGAPLARVRAATAGQPDVVEVVLAELSEEAVEGIVRERYGTVPAERLPAWLHDLSDGTPFFIDQYLSALEAQGVLRRDDGAWVLDGTIEGGPGSWALTGALARVETPAGLFELLRPRVADLDESERALLESGAVQGRRFLSTVIVRMLGRSEDEILDGLARLSERRRMIAAEDGDGWWSDRSALYVFEPGVLQELLLGGRSAYERRRRHRAVAEALEAMISEDRPPSRQALLEVARHYEEAQQPLQAATRLLEAADSTFAEGADRETAALAERALGLLRSQPQAQAGGARPPETERLLARAILFVLLGGESAWSADPAAGAGARCLALAQEAERAAAAAGDPKLQANARFATAHVLIPFGGLDGAMTAYREALELARAAGDPVAEFAILVDYGHNLDSVSLHDGWAVLQQAKALLAGGTLDPQLGGTRRRVEAERLEVRIGLAAFDLGRYGEALELLERGTQTLRGGPARDDLGWSLAFLAQLYTAIGLYDRAEASLREALALFAGETGALGIRSYLRGLLGGLYLEWDAARLPDARAALVDARTEAAASGFRQLAPLVECFWAELLLADGSPDALAEAERTLGPLASLDWARSEIAAASLRARVLLAQGRAAEALEPSSHAAHELERHGGAVPTIRGERILFTHGLVLEANGAPDAADWFARAAAIVHAKADSLSDPAQRQSYLERVRLSAAILGREGG